ncbi:MAG: transcriptional regulator [Candidatus Pacebacteria bacterium]|nr:transcriptional regulator [Candidatus Paceibacterota bacterium]
MTEEEQLNEFMKQVLSYKDKTALRSFFEAILTPKELGEIPTRLQIVKMLKKGIAQREIADKLGVGVATVTRGSKEILKGNFEDIL